MGKVEKTNRLPAAKAKMQAGMLKGLHSAGLIVVAQAKALTPVDTGALRDSFSHMVEDDEEGKMVCIIGNPLNYSIYVEYGTGEFAENGMGRKGGWAYETPDGKVYFTRGMKPRRMLTTAIRTKAEQVKQLINDEMTKAGAK